MMMCGFIQPHPPWSIPPEMDGLYDNVKIPNQIPISRLPFEQEDRAEWFGDNDTDEQREKIRKAYYTAVSMVDKSVGRILSYLKESGQLDNTLIIYTSDHGEMLQDKGYYSKELPYDSAAKVPFIVRYPKGFKQNYIDEGFVDLLDILPTCLDACGIEYPGERELYGKSLLNTLDREYQFSASGNLPLRWVMCRNKQYKYVYHYMDGYEELYDMEKPEVDNLLLGELSNELEAVVKDLKARALEYEEKWGIEGGVKNNAFVPCKADKIHPTVRSKFHFWSNSQMQKFYESNKYQRGSALAREMRYALANFEKSGVALEDVFNDSEWIDNFTSHYKTYTQDQEGTGDFPFKK